MNASTLVFGARVALLLSLLVPVAWTGLAAQTSTGSIRGTVTDAQGAPVADVQIIARELETNVQRTTTTNASGFYFLGASVPRATR